MGVTKEFIVLDVRRSCVLRTILCACISFGVYYLRVYPPHLEYWQLPSYYMSVLLMKITIVLWTCMNTCLRKSARDLNKCFKVSECCIQQVLPDMCSKYIKMDETSLTSAFSGVCLFHVRTTIISVSVPCNNPVSLPHTATECVCPIQQLHVVSVLSVFI